ncbi:DNA-binding transcriptional regulator LsrR, DeoR family [Paracoccus isoporae]|uniref:DNA-binding transcriptional regulator LsrR, DeoR family n=1 Tax=Paracoccus isoporae TaxID=591205 RepID=A0A1G6YY25_9RHOB|nr:sugar-binding transcriptional regulator [Paracoccus isoporae]SDD94545.1 DNA-binding transcriptional regulator LsrR, DeoR family [Paracoccus isoporae]
MTGKQAPQNAAEEGGMTRENNRLDQAARAAWMSWVGGMTQDEIARELGVSRQTAQRLAAQAMAAGIVKVRIDHPLTECLELAGRLRSRFGLRQAEVSPEEAGLSGVAMLTAEFIESQLGRAEPITLAIGTGRTLRAGVAQMRRMDCAQHRIVSLTGNIAQDGSAAYYNVLFALSDLVTAHSYPLMVPVIAATAEEREALHRQPGNRRVMDMAANADVALIGLGDFGPRAPLQQDRFLTGAEVRALADQGAVGEILGHAYDARGQMLPRDERVASAPLPDPARALIVAAARGPDKHAALLGALRSGLINGAICDAGTARWVLDQPSRDD